MEQLCNRKLLSASLLEWTLGSETTFLKAEDNKILIEKASKLGIELPSPDLAAFETIYCEVDKFNKNGVKFSKEVAKKGLKTLHGKQLNWNHSGANQICGYIIDAEIKENKIYITGILFKSLFKAEFDEVIKLFAEKKLYVSFELWNKKEDGKSVIKDLGRGYRELTEFIAHGCALLLIDPKTGEPIPPACPQAQVKKLLASTKVIEEAESIVEKVFEKDENLIYAELATPTCLKCKTCTCQNEGGVNIMEEIKVNQDEKVEPVVEEAKKKICPVCHQEVDEKDMTDEEMCAVCKKKKHEKAQETPEQAQVEQPAVVEEPKVEAQVTEPIVEAKVTEPTPEIPATEVTPEQAQVVEQPVEVKVEEANVTTTTTQVTEIVNTDNPSQDVMTKEVVQESVTVDKDGQELQKVEVEHKEVVTFTYEQLEQKVAEVRAELEAKLVEKDKEISTLKQELEQKTQEIASLQIKETEQPVLTVGNILPTADKYREIQKGIDSKAYPKK